MYDEPREIQIANVAATRLTGRSLKELEGHYQHGVIHHTRADGTPNPDETCAIYAVARTGIAHHEEEDLFWRKDGSSFPVSYTVTPLRNSGVLTGTVVVFKDITDSKKKEQSNKERREELEFLVRNKTTELRAAKEAADAASADALDQSRRRSRSYGPWHATRAMRNHSTWQHP